MDTVILAAGKGSRLNGIAAPFHKPLMVVNGRALVYNAAETAAARASNLGTDRIIIVCAPGNVEPIAHLTDEFNPYIIVQPNPTGPGDALLLGLELVQSTDVLVLMGDNTFRDEDVDRVMNGLEGANLAVGVQEVPAELSKQFTWYSTRDQTWREKVEHIGYEDVVSAWIGPFAAMSSELKRQLPNVPRNENGERPISPVFNTFRQDMTMVMGVTSEDIGTPEAFAS